MSETTGEIVKDQVSPLNIMSPENKYSEPKATEAAHLKGNITPTDPQVKDGLEITIPLYDNMGNSFNVLCTMKAKTEKGKYELNLKNILDKDGNPLANGYTVSFGTSTLGWTDGKPTVGGTAVTVAYNATTGELMGVGADNATDKSLKLTIKGDPNSFIVPTPEMPKPTGGKNGYSGDAVIDVDFSATTNFTTTSASTIGGARGTVDGKKMGRLVGNMTGVSVDGSGCLYGVYDNGDKKLLGQIAVATFPNAAGLEAVGNSMYRSSLNSGEFNNIGVDVTSVGGNITSGQLEMSNVDLAAEFTDMIVTQRGYQANSRIITTTDTMLEELINLKR